MTIMYNVIETAVIIQKKSHSPLSLSGLHRNRALVARQCETTGSS